MSIRRLVSGNDLSCEYTGACPLSAIGLARAGTGVASANTKPFKPLFFSYQRYRKPSTRILRAFLQPDSWKRRGLTQPWCRLLETSR